MEKTSLQTLVADQKILNRIYVMRKQKVMPARSQAGSTETWQRCMVLKQNG